LGDSSFDCDWKAFADNSAPVVLAALALEALRRPFDLLVFPLAPFLSPVDPRRLLRRRRAACLFFRLLEVVPLDATLRRDFDRVRFFAFPLWIALERLAATLSVVLPPLDLRPVVRFFGGFRDDFRRIEFCTWS
jgi:hypothetical protein